MNNVSVTSAALFNSQLSPVLQLCRDIDTPRSLAVSMLLSAGEYRQYIELSTKPDHYDNASDFADDYLVTEVLRKSPYLPVNIDRRAVALSAFWDSEIQCAMTNIRLQEEIPEFSHRFSREISTLVGPLNHAALSFIENNCKHGPGSCYGFRATGRVSSDKFDKTITATIDLYPFFKSLVGQPWHQWVNSPIEVVGGNKFTTVPKDAKTDRGICTEPLLNMFLQKGIGAYLKKRLAKFGFDQRTQPMRNRELASRAQRDRLATIDLSRASDTLASSVVKYFFPPDWFELLYLARSHRTLVSREWQELEKWSSMGNGYTFELESVIFLALVRMIVPKSQWRNIAVFGDDIICPQEFAEEVVKCLRTLGFQVNRKKTFLEGRFFESCGTDWFDGVDVRPFYLKEMHKNAPPELQIANRLRLYAMRRGEPFGSSVLYRPTWLLLKKKVPDRWKRCCVPPSAGDTGLIMSREEAKPDRLTRGWEGWRYRYILTKPKFRVKYKYSIFLASLMNDCGTDFTYNREPVKGYLGAVVPKWASCHSWPDGLSWI